MNRVRSICQAAIGAGVLLSLQAFGGGCSGDAREWPDARALADDSRYMAAIFDRRVDAHPFILIDLADDKQYGALVRRLLRSGNTPENSPELFARLEADREAALGYALPPGGNIRGESPTWKGPAWCGHMVPMFEWTYPGSSKFDVSAQASCFDGADYLYADIAGNETTQDGSSIEHLAFEGDEEYTGGVDFSTPRLEPVVGVRDGIHVFYADSFLVAYDAETGRSQYTYAAARTTVSAAPEDPNALQTLGPAAPSNPPGCLTNVHPRDLIDDPSTTSDDAITRICLERGIVNGNLDCDYATVDENHTPVWVNAPAIRGIAGVDATTSLASTPAKWTAQTTPPATESLKYDWPVSTAGTYDVSQLFIPMRGTYDTSKALGPAGTNCRIKSYEANGTYGLLSLVEAGGWCAAGTGPGTQVAKPGISAGFPTPDGSKTTSQLNLLGNFGPDCVGYHKKTRLTIQITTKVQCDGQPETTRQCTQTLQPIDFKNSCFAEGTEIVRADGTPDEVQNIKVGDKVIADAGGRQLTVVSVARGGERHPLVNIFDADGHDLFLTEKHPVVTADKGVVFAEQIVEGDLVMTERGPSVVVAVSRVHYDREVFNLSLGTAEELAAIRPDQRTMFAGGILVGDGAMQTEMELRTEPPAGDVASRVPEAWRKDYSNDLERKARASR